PSTPHSSGFARPASGAFYEAISLATFCEIIKINTNALNIFTCHCEPEGRGSLVFIGIASSSRASRDPSQ
ncbi:MAG: hypothetical protein NTY64_09785, partial [Deltaproteobacteria bacterium]|nr:hypothetical protein [Deltaproteobacteria bacterium]